jgi:hypothetical protein
MPHGTSRWRPYSIWRRTLARQLWSSRVPGKFRISSCGIKYSNIVPPQDISVARPPTFVTRRPRWNQWCCGTSPLAMATKLANRASDANRS